MNDTFSLLDPHIHSVASGHGSTDTVTDIAKAAKEKGLEMIGITEHGPSYPGTCGVSYFRNIALAPKRRFGVDIRYGAEVNILDDKGTLDLNGEVLGRLDYNIASLHTKCMQPGNLEYNTNAYIEAMKQPYIHMIGHADDVAFPVDYEKLVKAAVTYRVLPEINNASLSPEGYRGNARGNTLEIIRCCRKYGHPVVVSSDSHGKSHVGEMKDALLILQEAGFPAGLVMNRRPELFIRFLSSQI